VTELTVALTELDAERACEVLPELVRGPHLQGLAVPHQPLARPGDLGTRELLALRLASLEDRNGQLLDHRVGIHLNEDPLRVIVRLCPRRVSGMPLRKRWTPPLISKEPEPDLGKCGIRRSVRGFR